MPKYQVFVSSTYTDLKIERDLVIRAILEMGHIPVGMEMFSAADEEQWSIIRKQIEQTDYYVVIVAHRYGSCDQAGTSYTEKEYDCAVALGVPALGLVIDDSVSWPREKSDNDPHALDRLNRFKNKVKGKPVSFWRNCDDLYGKCTIALMKAFNAYPREGWIRSSLAQDAAASKELTRLSAENADLRARLSAYQMHESSNKTMEDVVDIMRGSKKKIPVWRVGHSTWSEAGQLALYQIFESLAPALQVDCNTRDLCRLLAMAAGVKLKELRDNWPTPSNVMKELLADLAALDCVMPSRKKKPVADKDEYWTLTDFGAKLQGFMRLRRLKEVESLSVAQMSQLEGSSADKVDSATGQSPEVQ